MSILFYDRLLVEAKPYRFRGLPMSIKPPGELWGICGQVFRGDDGAGGVLEWCYSKEDADRQLVEMKKDPSLYCLSAAAYSDWQKENFGHKTKEERKKQAILRQRGGEKLKRLICKAIEGFQKAQGDGRTFREMKTCPDTCWTDLAKHLIELGLLGPFPENPFTVERYDWDQCYWDGVMVLLYEIARLPLEINEIEWRVRIDFITTGIAFAERNRREVASKCGLPDTGIFMMVLSPNNKEPT